MALPGHRKTESIEEHKLKVISQIIQLKIGLWNLERPVEQESQHHVLADVSNFDGVLAIRDIEAG